MLAGGASRRMGCDKAFIEIDGRAMVSRAADALAEAGAGPVLVVGGDAAGVEALGLRHVADTWPGDGPLGAIITALDALDADLVAVLACDLVDASPLAVRTVVSALGASDVAVPVVDGHPQWLHAVWRRSARGALRSAFEAGVRAPKLAVDALHVTHILDADPCWFHDADRLSDLPADRI